MDERARFDAGLAIRREVLGAAHVDRSLARRNAFTEEFQDLLTRHAWGEIWARERLDRKTRSLVTIAMLVGLGRFEELKLHVRGALNNGLEPEDIKEVLLQAAVYCGVPAGVSAFQAAGEVLAEEGRLGEPR
jgi:3-oxoadipate enol-lactonase/4-carboxymuconolactone decarboxylase